MTIIELIMAGLQQKFAGVDTAILSRIATKKAEGVTDEKAVNSIVEGIGFADVLNSYGDFRAGDARITAIANYEKKHNLKNGLPIGDGDADKEEPDDDKNMAKIIAEAVNAAITPLSEKLNKYEADKAKSLRESQILSKAKEYGIPENYAKRCAIKDDDDLDAYFKELKQDFANDGFKGVTPPETAEQRLKEDNKEISSMIADGTKKIVESKK